jgi:hypothetical protein
MAAFTSRVKDQRILAKAPGVEPVALTTDQYCQRYQIARHTLRKAIEAGLVTVHRFGPKCIRIADAPPRPLAEG